MFADRAAVVACRGGEVPSRAARSAKPSTRRPASPAPNTSVFVSTGSRSSSSWKVVGPKPSGPKLKPARLESDRGEREVLRMVGHCVELHRDGAGHVGRVDVRGQVGVGRHRGPRPCGRRRACRPPRRRGSWRRRARCRRSARCSAGWCRRRTSRTRPCSSRCRPPPATRPSRSTPGCRRPKRLRSRRSTGPLPPAGPVDSRVSDARLAQIYVLIAVGVRSCDRLLRANEHPRAVLGCADEIRVRGAVDVVRSRGQQRHASARALVHVDRRRHGRSWCSAARRSR